MSTSLKRIPEISWGWAEGHYWDLWMLVHLVSGLIIGNILVFLPFSTMAAVWIALMLLYLGEAIEFLFKIKESRINRITDIIIGFIGFVASYVTLTSATRSSQIVSLVIFALLSGAGNFLGWRAHRKRAR